MDIFELYKKVKDVFEDEMVFFQPSEVFGKEMLCICVESPEGFYASACFDLKDLDDVQDISEGCVSHIKNQIKRYVDSCEKE